MKNPLNQWLIKITSNFIILIVLILVLAFNVTAGTQDEKGIEERISRLLQNKIEFDSLKTIIKEMIHTWDTNYLCIQLDKIIAATSKDENSKSHVLALIAYGQCRTKKTMPRLNEAYRIALKNNYTDLLAHTLDTKGVIFKEKGMYDSLLVTLLEAKDIYEENANTKALVPILHSTADLYFRGKFYDKAEALYLKILEQKGDQAEWEFWRNTVILNNLGLIEIKRAHYGKALDYFKKAYNIIIADSTISRFGMAMGYNILRFSDCYLRMGKDRLASLYYDKSLPYVVKNKMYTELTELYTIKSKLFFRKGETDSSLVYAQKAYNTFQKNKSSKNSLLDIYKLFYNIFNQVKDYKQANTYLTLFANLQDSLNHDAQSAREMQILAGNEYQQSVRKINDLKTKNYLLITLITFTLLFLMIVFSFYIRLKKANKRLVDKSLEIVEADCLTNENKGTATKNLSDDTQEQLDLIYALNQLMKQERTYLKSDLSIKEVAKKLNTNRTYLSRAINMVLKKNFVVYVNELRIKEAIRGISAGDYSKFTIEGIASEVGFNNRVSFNSAFKKYTGTLPSYFISEVSKRGYPSA